MNASATSTINSIRLIKEDMPTVGALVERDCEIALSDLKKESHFQPINDTNGPYNITLSLKNNSLLFEVNNSNKEKTSYLGLSLTPYKRIIKDYFMIVGSYDEAVRDGKPSRIEAIDMGRRGLHNEGAELLQERLKDKIILDLNTARRLFTLICILHTGKIHALRD